MLAHLTLCWRILGAMLAHLGAMLEQLGGYVGASWGYVGPSWPGRGHLHAEHLGNRRDKKQSKLQGVSVDTQ